MNYAHVTPGLIHREHLATIGLLERLEAALTARRPSGALEDGAFMALLGEVAATVENEVGRHFTFEQEALFPLLAEAGDGDIAALLQDEHAAILPLGTRLAELARRGRDHGFGPGDWAEFLRLGRELIERQIGHIQKEEMSLLPLLDSMLSDETDAELADSYNAAR
jgi:hemerythrin-like domain-containing protein